MNVEVTPLPGIGIRQDFAIRSGRRIGVITYRDGKFELILSKQDDPDATAASIPLAPEEAGTLAGLLGAPNWWRSSARQHRDITGITTRSSCPSRAFAHRTLGDTALRTRTGASIVAVVRAGMAHPSPGPEFLFENGDLAVVVGTAEGLDAAADILTGG